MLAAWEQGLVPDWTPPPTLVVVERASGVMVRINASDFDETAYSRIESRVLGLGATYESESVE
jgi:hypothetical protein